MKIRLSSKSILGIPLVKCDDDFTFIVNNQEYETNRIKALLLSPKIRNFDLCDPCYHKMVINTNKKGNFQNILDLTNFHIITIPEIEVPFFLDVIQQLGTESIHFLDEKKEITFDNVFKKIKIHEECPEIYEKQLKKEINFISSNFYKLFKDQPDEVKKLTIGILEKVLTNPKLRLITEDQILTMVNDLYINDRSYSILYEYVNFVNVSSKTMKEFSDIFDMNDLTNQLWLKLLERMNQNEPQRIDYGKYPGRYEYTPHITVEIDKQANYPTDSKEIIQKNHTIKEIVEILERERIIHSNFSENYSESESDYEIW